MARIFAYIAHKGGVVDDSAYELAAAAKKPTGMPFVIDQELTLFGLGCIFESVDKEG